MTAPIRILIVDDHPIVRQGISSLLSNFSEFEIIGEAESGWEALTAIADVTPDVILLDISMPEESGIDILCQIQTHLPQAKVLMLTSFDDEEYVVGALKAGALGYILKSASDEKLVNAIRAVHRGERVFSPQVTEKVVQRLLSGKPLAPLLEPEEIQLLRMLTEGASNSEIASAMYLSNTSVKRRLRQIFEKMNVNSRAQAAAEAVRRGLI